MDSSRHDVWALGEAYDGYVGRWSRAVAAQFVRWLAAPVGGAGLAVPESGAGLAVPLGEARAAVPVGGAELAGLTGGAAGSGVPAGARWLDVGCGTGALSEAILAGAEPETVVGVDPSAGFLEVAKARNPGLEFHVGDARQIPLGDNAFDAVVSGLALNFVPEPARAVAECVRVARAGGVVAAYVWDYAEGMEMMRHFWDVAAELDSAAEQLDEGRRFTMCRPEGLRELWGGMADVVVEPIDIPTVFEDFSDYWRPFLGGQGSAPGYAMSLSERQRDALREGLRARLGGGRIALTARAWAVRGRVIS